MAPLLWKKMKTVISDFYRSLAHHLQFCQLSRKTAICRFSSSLVHHFARKVSCCGNPQVSCILPKMASKNGKWGPCWSLVDYFGILLNKKNSDGENGKKPKSQVKCSSSCKFVHWGMLWSLGVDRLKSVKQRATLQGKSWQTDWPRCLGF